MDGTPENLTINTDMPGGNAHVLECHDAAGSPEVHFMPLPSGAPEAMWFYFQITPADSSTTARSGSIQCRLHLPDNLLGGSRSPDGFLPVFRTQKEDWQRVAQVTMSEREDGRPIFQWHVPADEGRIEVALCYPYGQDELNALAQTIGWRQDVIGVTDRGRELTRLSNGVGEPGSARPGIYCVAGQHAGETPGSWMLDGFLRGIAAAGEQAPLVWAVPFVDLDGVVEGRFGKDAFPWDYNRSWGSKRFPKQMYGQMGTHPMRHEVRCVQTDMVHWCGRCAPALALDFHAPVMCLSKGVFCYVLELDKQGQPDAEHRPWVDAVCQAVGSDLARQPFALSSQYPSRWNTARSSDFACTALGIPQLTIETPYACAQQTVLSRATYQQTGHRIAEALIERCGQLHSTLS